MAEIKLFSFNFAPRGWAMCNGQLMPIAQNQALFSLLGTMYGGNGRTTFGLPNMQGKIPIHIANGYNQGTTIGEENHTLTPNELPAHTHEIAGGTATLKAGGTANSKTPEGNFFGENTNETKRFSARSDASMANASPTISNAGGGMPHTNMQPYLVLNYCIALQGAFPSRN